MIRFDHDKVSWNAPDPIWAIRLRRRAADASHSSLLRVSTKGGIAIAVFAVLYFAAEFLR